MQTIGKAQQSGTEFAPVRVRTVKDEVTGQSRKVEVPKKLKPWWWADEKGRHSANGLMWVGTICFVFV
jgi:hypothetical protein